jgi:hypothetical protein
MTRILMLLAALIVASAATPAVASADPASCRAGADGQWYSQTGQRCRGNDINQWHIGNSPQLYCWYYPTDPMCKDSRHE